MAYSLQALLIVALLVSFAAVNPALYWWAGTAFVTKAILTPYFLFRVHRHRPTSASCKPLIGFGAVGGGGGRPDDRRSFA